MLGARIKHLRPRAANAGSGFGVMTSKRSRDSSSFVFSSCFLYFEMSLFSRTEAAKVGSDLANMALSSVFAALAAAGALKRFAIISWDFAYICFKD